MCELVLCKQVVSAQVDEARCNDRGPLQGMDEALIYNYEPHFTGRVRHRGEEADFEQCYFLPPYAVDTVYALS